ncbi:hypothetical protein B0A48_16889 [Cryoendolithus antarcticus]|uniref:DNA replication factor Cdt1 C-terminal domain-containing protein n=1 Tax=Cryoendolithus antarcticus TaxID=1507870 RepID=A0A1V8SD64_9PEZI|nr:hypothetical protein B0A48_16889 [Cryoendolithus antarcticus]
MAPPRKRKQTEIGEASEHPQHDLEIVKDHTPSTEDAIVGKRRKVVHERAATPPPRPVAVKGRSKRKRALESVSEEPEQLVVPAPKPQERVFAKFTKRATRPATPQTQRHHDVFPMSPAQTPTKSAAQLFDRLNLRASSPAPVQPNKRQRPLDTPPATPESDRVLHFADLPEELQDFIRLYSAFLTAIGLQYAHNGGSSAAIPIKTLLPAVTASWRKRSVTTVDVRKLLAQQGSKAMFILEDRARAGLYLAKAAGYDDAPHAGRLIDATQLSADLEAHLQKAWSVFCAATRNEICTGRAFIRQLPLADVQQHESSAKAGPLYAKGEQRLADLRAGQAAAQVAQATEKAMNMPADKSAVAVRNRGTSLLDRILAKQNHAASMSAGPSRDELERKSALHRIEDVARVLEVLTVGKPRASFAMQTLVRDIQQSLRTPISREEAERCLTLMAAEVMPGFVKVLDGNVKGVVVTRQGKLGLADLKQRLADAGA